MSDSESDTELDGLPRARRAARSRFEIRLRPRCPAGDGAGSGGSAASGDRKRQAGPGSLRAHRLSRCARAVVPLPSCSRGYSPASCGPNRHVPRYRHDLGVPSLLGTLRVGRGRGPMLPARAAGARALSDRSLRIRVPCPPRLWAAAGSCSAVHGLRLVSVQLFRADEPRRAEYHPTDAMASGMPPNRLGRAAVRSRPSGGRGTRLEAACRGISESPGGLLA